MQENEKSNTKEFAQINVGQIKLQTLLRIFSKTFKVFLSSIIKNQVKPDQKMSDNRLKNKSVNACFLKML